jgi:hypothetical protein
MKIKHDILLIFVFCLLSSCGSKGSSNKKFFVGAPGDTHNTGLVYQCDSTGTNCDKIDLPSLTPNDRFGTALAHSSGNLFVGAPGTNNNQGALYVCQQDGSHCQQANTGLSLSYNQYFASALLYMGNSLYVGAPGDSGVTGQVYQCSSVGTQCAAMPQPSGMSNFLFGKSLASSLTTLFVGASNGTYNGQTSATGVVYEYDAINTTAIQLTTPSTLLTSDEFGTALSFFNASLYVGAPGINTDQGGLFQCDSSGINCSFLTPPADSQLSDKFGSALMPARGFLYVGAPGRHFQSGRVYQCASNGLSCNVLNPPDLEPNDLFGAAITDGNT